MAFAGNPKLICGPAGPEFIDRPEDGSNAFKAGELVYTLSTGYLSAIVTTNSAVSVILGQVQTDSTAVAGTRHKVQVITPDTDIEIVTSAVCALAYEGQKYGNTCAANVHTLNFSETTDPTFYVKRVLRENPDSVHGAYIAKAVVRLRGQANEMYSSLTV